MRHTFVTIAAIASIALAATACTTGPPDANQREQQQQQGDTTSLVNNQPIPHFNYSQERAALIAAEQISANGTQTTSFFFNQGVRDPIFVCPSIGEGIPDSAELSNPQQVVGTGNNNAVTIGQMDPFGVYTPTSSTGTYVICVNPQGQEYLRRWEGFVDTITAPAVWNYTTHTEQLVGAPSTQIKTKR